MGAAAASTTTTRPPRARRRRGKFICSILRYLHASRKGWLSFYCRHQAGGRRWIAIPEPPAEPAARDLGGTKFGQRFRVAGRDADVGNGQPAAPFQDPPGFPNRLGASFVRVDIVDGKAGHHDIKGAVGKW